MEDNDENRSDTYLDELLRRINPNAILEKDVHEALMEFANDYVNKILDKACSLTQHRGSNKLTKEDVNYVLAHHFNK